jgi:hypothetical protein
MIYTTIDCTEDGENGFPTAETWRIADHFPCLCSTGIADAGSGSAGRSCRLARRRGTAGI